MLLEGVTILYISEMGCRKTARVESAGKQKKRETEGDLKEDNSQRTRSSSSRTKQNVIGGLD